MLELEIASLLASSLLFYYTFKFYRVLSDTKLQDALRMLLNGFLLLVLQAVIGVAQEFGYLQYSFPKGDLDELFSLIAYILIVAAMIRLRRVFVEFEVQKKAIKTLRSIFEK
jgi:putative effector of murein hydrolase LrgA (UPF0299 family)